MKGSRIHSIVRELRNENIDVINWTENEELLMQRALLKPDQVSLAIGKGGNNIKLAGHLTGYEIDVFREEDETEDDVELMEFSDEIDTWILEEFIKIGCDTARSVLEIDEESLIARTDLEAETVKEVLRILNKELE